MFVKILIIVGLAAAGLLFIILTTVTPSTAGAFGILAVFLLSYIVTLSSFTFALWLLGQLITKIGNQFKKRNGAGKSLTFKKAYYYSSIISLAPVIIVSLQSVGEVTIYEIGLVGLFLVLGCVYVAKRSA
jgi:hypothetical protein